MLGAAPAPGGTPAGAAGTAGAAHPGFPRQDPARVAEVVGVSHRDLDRVRALVEESPALANADWDWGFGDWETPLGAASHVGRRDIAEYLLSRGARPSIFSAAMLGQLAVVRAFVEADPAFLKTPGPHGIPLVNHARAGGPPAAEVLRYLESLSDAAPSEPAVLSAEQRAAYRGRYGFGPGTDEFLEVGERGDRVTIRRSDWSDRPLVPAGEHAFHPVGTPGVRVVFEVSGGVATAVAVHDGPLVVTAARLATPAAAASSRG